MNMKVIHTTVKFIKVAIKVLHAHANDKKAKVTTSTSGLTSSGFSMYSLSSQSAGCNREKKKVSRERR